MRVRMSMITSNNLKVKDLWPKEKKKTYGHNII